MCVLTLVEDTPAIPQFKKKTISKDISKKEKGIKDIILIKTL